MENIMKCAASAGLLLAGLCSQVAFASSYLSCDGCDIAEMRGAALSHGVGRHVVGNVTGGNAQAFRVYLAPQPRVIGMTQDHANRNRLFADYDILTSQESSAFLSLVKFYNAYPVGYQKTYVLQIVPPGTPLGDANTNGALASTYLPKIGEVSPQSEPPPGMAKVSYPTPGVTVYNVVTPGPEQNVLLTWVGQQTVFNINSVISNAVDTSVLHSLGAASPSVRIVVTFTDGSHIDVGIDDSGVTPRMVVNEDSAVDSHGNNVPASPSAVAGNGKQIYGFGGFGNKADQGNMAKLIGSYGISVPSSPVYACVKVGNAPINCTWVQ